MSFFDIPIHSGVSRNCHGKTNRAYEAHRRTHGQDLEAIPPLDEKKVREVFVTLTGG